MIIKLLKSEKIRGVDRKKGDTCAVTLKEFEKLFKDKIAVAVSSKEYRKRKFVKGAKQLP